MINKSKSKNNIKNTIKNNKGNWEFNFFQKCYNPNEEANINNMTKR